MKQIIKWILFIALLSPNLVLADIAVIVNVDNPTVTISPVDLKNIYRVRVAHFSDTYPIILSYQPAENEVTQLFFNLVIDKSMTELTRYWATKIFSGRMERPIKLEDDALVIEWVSRNRSGLGYIYDKNLTDRVKKIATIEVKWTGATDMLEVVP